jgi:hypothetical protein
MVGSIPMGDKIKITEKGTGRGIVVQIPQATGSRFDKYTIDLKQGTSAKQELNEIVKLIINYSLGKQRVLLDQDGKDSYVADYGTYTGEGENRTRRAPTE